jgi:MFS family permease
MMALTLALVAGAVPRERTGRAMGLLGSTSAIGTALGPSLGGALIAVVGWRAIFLVNVPLGAAALVLARRHLGDDRARAGRGGRGLNLPGTALLALTLCAYALALTLDGGRITPRGLALLVAALGGTAALARVERRSAAPLIGAATLRDPALRTGLAASAVVSTVMMSTLIVGPFHLARALGLGPAAVGAAMSVGPAVVAVAGMPAGRIADRLGARRVAVAGLAAMAAGALLIALAPTGAGVAGYLGPMAVLALGYAAFQTANTTAVMAAAGEDRRGVTSGLLTLSRNLGLVTGASVMGTLFALASGAAAGPGEVAAGTRATFLLAAALLVAAALAGAGAGSLRRRVASVPASGAARRPGG